MLATTLVEYPSAVATDNPRSVLIAKFLVSSQVGIKPPSAPRVSHKLNGRAQPRQAQEIRALGTSVLHTSLARRPVTAKIPGSPGSLALGKPS